ncbi:MAG TPA: bifunctional nuclease family protein [bacterium]|nr:bifunctional nuclease family protein [bacterium]
MEKVSIEGVILNARTNAPVLILKGSKGNILPIAVGIFEAQSILLVLEKTSFLRPLTHDLIKRVVESLSAEFLRLEIHTIKNSVYFAHMVLRTGDRIEKIDCRPSDGIAVALRFNGNIFVADSLMSAPESVKYSKSAKFFKTGRKGSPIGQSEAEEFRKMIEGMSAKDFWKEINEK